eukprot:7734523-Ditylum_brightwellii.AAC.1
MRHTLQTASPTAGAARAANFPFLPQPVGATLLSLGHECLSRQYPSVQRHGPHPLFLIYRAVQSADVVDP